MRSVIAFAVAVGAACPANGATSGPPLAGLAAPESSAYELWSLRAGLNVAAIQCQFSGFLRTVPTYNGLVNQHGKEFTAANTTLGRYFTRTKGARASALEFDRFNTRLWQSFSSIDAQLAFCDAAASVGREVLATPVGKLGPSAGPLLARIRQSFGPPAPEALGGMTSITVPVTGWSVADIPTCPARDRQRGRC
jgi:hypothetical protein